MDADHGDAGVFFHSRSFSLHITVICKVSSPVARRTPVVQYDIGASV